MRRTRKQRVVWLPPDPFNKIGIGGQSPANTDSASITQVTLLHGAGQQTGNFTGKAIPLIADLGNAEAFVPGTGVAGAPSLSDMYNSGYRLRRIAGFFSAALQQTGGGQNPNDAGSCMLTAAMIVMRVDASGLPVNAQAAPPDTMINQDNPWIWRRSWCFTNFATQIGQILPQGSSNTFGAGSMKEGSFIDQKTARVVSNDERLFMCLQLTQLDGNDAGTADLGLVINWNLRFLASLRNNLGNRRNASR